MASCRPQRVEVDEESKASYGMLMEVLYLLYSETGSDGRIHSTVPDKAVLVVGPSVRIPVLRDRLRGERHRICC